MIQSQQSRRIQSLIIRAPEADCRLTVEKLRKIYEMNGEESLEDIMNSVQQLSFLKKQIEKKYKDLSSMLIDFVCKSKHVDLLINGDYIIDQKQRILIFSPFRILFCSKKLDELNKSIYKGIQYKIGKSYYHGYFQIGSNDLVYSNGELFLLTGDKLCEKYEGRWSEGSIIEGTKQIFEYKQLDMIIIRNQKAQEQYKGEFKNMKYEGKGTLIKKSILEKGKETKTEGIFKNGKLEIKQKQQLI